MPILFTLGKESLETGDSITVLPPVRNSRETIFGGNSRSAFLIKH